jgi:copper chaperone CopZ
MPPFPSSGVVGGQQFGEIARMRLELSIAGMVAVHAKYAVFQALAAVEGITRAEVELGRVELEMDREPDETQLHEAIASVGFTLSEIRRLPRTLPML